MNLPRHLILTRRSLYSGDEETVMAGLPGRVLAHALVCLVSTILWTSSASADLIEIRAAGEITGGRDERCLFGDATCVQGPNDGFLFAGAGISIESVWTFDTDTAPADADDRPNNSQRFAATNWLDLYLRIFDATNSFEFAASSFVDQPELQRGQLNVANEATESIFIEANHSRGFGANLPQTILESKAGISFLDLLSSDELTDSFSWQSGVDPGLGGIGEFDVFRCFPFQPSCEYAMGGVFQIDLLTVTNLSREEEPVAVSEPATLPLLAAGLLLLVFIRRRPN